MKTFEDDIRGMLHRRAEDVAPVPPPWQQFTAGELQHHVPATRRARRTAAIAAIAAVVLGAIATQLARRDDPPPATVGTGTDQHQPPFDPETTSAIWPVGREGTPTSWFRTAMDEATRLQPPASDDPGHVAIAYLRDRFGPTAVMLADTAEHGSRTATYQWRARVGTQGTTGQVHLRRVVLPNGFGNEDAWVVVGATSDHLLVMSLRPHEGRLQFELARHEASFVTTVRLHLPTGTSLVDLQQPQAFDLALDQPISVRAQLLDGAGAPLTLTEFRVEPPPTLQPGKSLANIRGVLWTGHGESAVHVARDFLGRELDAGELRVEPAGEGTQDVRYTSARIGSGLVRVERLADAWAVVAVVGDGLAVDSMATTDDVRRLTLSSQLPGVVTVTLRKGRGQEVVGRGSTRLPGVDMLAGVLVTMTGELDARTAPVGEFRVDGPQGTTVAMYCLPG